MFRKPVLRQLIKLLFSQVNFLNNKGQYSQDGAFRNYKRRPTVFYINEAGGTGDLGIAKILLAHMETEPTSILKSSYYRRKTKKRSQLKNPKKHPAYQQDVQRDSKAIWYLFLFF